MTEAVDLRRAFRLLAEWVNDGVVPGVSLAVSQHGELIGTFAAGKKSAGSGGPVDENTLYPIASISKPFTAALVMRLVDRGILTLDEPVRRFLPVLDTGKRDLNLRDLLRHTSGLPMVNPDEPVLWEREASFDEIVASHAALPIEDTARNRVWYSNPGYWLAGAAAANACNLPFAEALQQEVLDPFGLRGEVVVSPDVALNDRIARRYGKVKMINTAYGRALASPTGGLFATARGLTRFASIFLAGGVAADGTRVLSRGAVTAMTTNQTGELPGGIPGFAEWTPGGWGLGWEIRLAKPRHWTGDFTSAATFAHPGQSGCLLWGDPATGIACAVLANRDIYTGWTDDPARWARLGNTLVASLAKTRV